MLICDKRRPRPRGSKAPYLAPQRGAHSSPLARFACGLQPAPRALLDVGHAAPRPPGLRPLCAFAHRAPAASVIQPEGFRARVRRWRGWATACGCPCPTPSPWRFSGFWEVSKSWAAQSAAGGSGGVPPVSVERWATRKWPVGGQGAAARLCPPSTGHRVVHGGTGSGHGG